MDFSDIKSTILYSTGYENYFPHQNEIIEKINCNDDKNIIIQAPTSSGKTLAISPFIYNEFLKNRRLVYAVPSKAMLFDKRIELEEYFSGFDKKPIIKKVGSDDTWKFGHIVIGTFEEIYNGALNQNTLSFFNNIILDDFHVLYGQTRGYTLEKLIAYILTNLDMKFIALSATIAPLDLLSKWLKEALVLKYDDDVRPVKLEHQSLDINELKELSKISHRPILIFCNTKNNTSSRANKLKIILTKSGKNIVLSDRRKIIKEHDKNRVDFDIDDEELLGLMEYGIAYHHQYQNPLCSYHVLL
jgi:replicative superfamily II helicase